MPIRLLACPSCSRHIRVDEERCPFCRGALPDDFGAGPVTMPPPPGLSRAERYAYAARMVGGGTLVATTLTLGCSSGDMVIVEYGAACSLPDACELVPFESGADSEASAPPDGATEAMSDDGGSDAEPDASPTDGAGDVIPDASPPSDAGDGKE